MTTPSYPYGYKYAKNGKCIVNESKAEIVRWIYKEFIGGKNRIEIKRELIDRSIVRPNGDGCQWAYTMVNKILMDKRYLGDHRFPALLDGETFFKAETRFEDDRAKAITVRSPGCTDDRKYPFSGYIQCGTCGFRLIRKMINYKGKRRICGWGCYTSYKLGKDKCPRHFAIYEETLDTACREIFNKLVTNPDLVLPDHTGSSSKANTSISILLKEAIEGMKTAIEQGKPVEEIEQHEETINILLSQQISEKWKTTIEDLSPFVTEDMINFLRHEKPMEIFNEVKMKSIFAKIITLEPGKLGFVLKNGKQLIQEYEPIRGQLKKWQES